MRNLDELVEGILGEGHGSDQLKQLVKTKGAPLGSDIHRIFSELLSKLESGQLPDAEVDKLLQGLAPLVERLDRLHSNILFYTHKF